MISIKVNITAGMKRGILAWSEVELARSIENRESVDKNKIGHNTPGEPFESVSILT